MSEHEPDSSDAGFDRTIVAWRSATAAPSDSDPNHGLRAYRQVIAGHSAWVLVDGQGGVVELADSLETLKADHPRARIEVLSTA